MNSVGEIQQETKPIKWRHVTGQENPADDISRGSTVQDLENDELRWQGSTFLLKEESTCPNVNIYYDMNISDEWKEITRLKSRLCPLESRKLSR